MGKNAIFNKLTSISETKDSLIISQNRYMSGKVHIYHNILSGDKSGRTGFEGRIWKKTLHGFHLR